MPCSTSQTDGDTAGVADALAEAAAALTDLEKGLEAWEERRLLSGQYDAKCVLAWVSAFTQQRKRGYCVL